MLWFKKKEKVNKEAEVKPEAVSAPADTGSNTSGNGVSDNKASDNKTSDNAASGNETAGSYATANNTQHNDTLHNDAFGNAASDNAASSDGDSGKVAPFAMGMEASVDSATEGQDYTKEDATVAGNDVPVKTGFFAKLKQGLKRTRDNFVYNLDVVFKGAEEIDDAFYDDLEEILITGDIGVQTTEEILDRLKEQVSKRRIVRPDECRELLVSTIEELMHVNENEYIFEKETSVIFVIGVNGVGKTTSIGKLASQFKNDGKRVIIAAADTFRAAAGDQLKVWADRAGCELISGKEGADPSSVLFDAVAAAKARRADILLVDTAGRLNNKKNLMNELSKMNKIIDKNYPEAHRENFIVLDATTGQNALQQALAFNEVSDLTGIILTKMDGTAKGGIAVAIQSGLHVPVKYIGVGEKIEDLQKFDEKAYVKALFEREKDETDNA